MQPREVAPMSHEETEKEWKKEIKAAEERIMGKMEEGKTKKKKRCIVFTDSNGRDATTASSVKYHMPEEDREVIDINIVVAFRIGQATSKVEAEAEDLGIEGAVVLIDCHNNDARQTKYSPRLPLPRYIQELDNLRKKLWKKGAAEVIVCALKPTQRADVSEYVKGVHRYLGGMRDVDGGHGCHTQVRLEHLRAEGLHLQPRFFYVLQQTYAYALMGKFVPDPTPLECFVPDHVRQVYQREWPALRASRTNHGWRP